MKRRKGLHYGWKAFIGIFALLAVLYAGLAADGAVIVSHAESTGRVTASSAKIRKEPNTTSETVGSAEQGATVSVKGQTTASDGQIWYQVTTGDITGYIRSDLMTITDGGTPGTIVAPTTSTPATPTTSTPDETVVEVVEVEPVSASVSGGSPVRVRQNASTTSRIVSTAQSGVALTVTGQAVGKDGKDWYRVNFISGGSEVNGFIRADYVKVNGELTAPSETPGDLEGPGAEEPEQPEEIKDWDTYYEGDAWHLLEASTGKTWEIGQIFSSVDANKQTLEEMIKKNKTQQIILIILVILLILLATALSFVIFKLKDMADSAYFNEVEKETLHRRTVDRPIERNRNGQRPAQRPAGGSERRPAGAGGNGQRPAGTGGNGQRPAGTGGNGQRPVGAGGNGQRPAGAGGNGQRPAGAGGNGQRPAGAGGNGQRPAGAGGNGQRPVEAGGQRRPAENPNSARPQQEQRPDYGREPMDMAQAQSEAPAQPQRPEPRKAKSFVNNDEFEFQFLDWDEEKK